jgi:hypothetical protein
MTTGISTRIDKLHWSISKEEQQEAISYLIDNIRDEDLNLLIFSRLDKGFWDNAALVLKGLGYPKVKPVLPKILEWIQDMNWPGSFEILDLLKQIGDPILPHLRIVFRSKDGIWIYNILHYLVSELSKDSVCLILDEINSLLEINDENIDLQAILILAKYRLMDGNILLELCNIKLYACNHIDWDRSDDIKKIIKTIECNS